MNRMRRSGQGTWLPLFAAACAFALVGCGGGGTPDANASPATGNGAAPTSPSGAPDVALLVVGGHSAFDAAPNYMEKTCAPYLAAEFETAGFTVATYGFVDDADGPNGFGALKARLAAIRDEWIEGRGNPTHVVLVVHSHGGPWAHAATRDVPDCPVRCFVDLDTSSYGWGLVHTADDLLGGNPVGLYTIPVTVNPPEYPSITSPPGDRYDLEDVVFPSVREELEVVTGALVPDLDDPTRFLRYDERWNARLDGTVGGISRLFTGTTHSEPVIPPELGGTTLFHVKDWILERLSAP